MRFSRFVALIGLAALLSVGGYHLIWAQIPTPGSGSCYGNDLPPGVVVLVDPISGQCFVNKQAPNSGGVISDNFEGTKATYSASVVGLATAATATDVVTLSASATKLTRLTQAQIICTGTAVSVPVTLVKRSTLDTVGTPAAMTAVPNDSTDAVATASAQSWTANPTLGATVGAVRATTMSVNAAAAVNPPTAAVFQLGFLNDKTMLLKKNSTEQLAINFNSTSITSPLCTAFISWTEE